jgi:uncharacterized membrane protein
MVQLHPPCSGMPLAFVTLLVVVEFIALCFSKKRVGGIRNVLVVACLVATAGAFFSGYQASAALGDLNAKQQELLAIHHTLGKLLLFNALFLGTWCFVMAVAKERLHVWRSLYLLALVVQMTVTVWVGFFGGELVFKHAVGVQGVICTAGHPPCP